MTELERMEAAVDLAIEHVKQSSRRVEEHLAALINHKQRSAIAAQKLQDAVDQHKATLLLSADLDGEAVSDAAVMHDGLGLRG